MHRFALFLLVFVVACASTPRPVLDPRGGPNPGGAVHPDADYADAIPSPAVWAALAATPGRERLARTEVVKVIVDLDDHDRIYFLQSRRWEIHYFFAARFLSTALNPVEDHGAFNIREYRRPDRRFVLGTLMHQRDTDAWWYELVAGDTLDVPRTVRVFNAIRARTWLGDRLRYHPVPPGHDDARADFVRAGVPVLSSDEIYAGMVYQPVNPGVAFGTLRIIDGPLDPTRVRRTDVLVLAHAPLDLPVCAGVITQEFQTPLSHLAILATNRGTADMGLRDALQHPTVRALDGRLVQLTVTPQGWTLVPATQADAERAWESMRPRSTSLPALSPTDPGLPELARLRRGDLGVAGAKAAQLGELAAIGGAVAVPRGFVIPFAAYLAHGQRSGATVLRDVMLADAAARSDPDRRAEQLRLLRERIATAPVDPALLAAVRARVRELIPTSRRIRLRSSTNAEDLPGFNGAGLYRSVVIDAGATDAALADAIRAVWASTWNLQAHQERSFFRIDESRVAMAILVQESIDDDVVNGVAITANPFNEGRPAYFINAQVAGDEGGSVTSARADQVPEQVIYYTYGEAGEFERIARSSLTNGAAVLTEAELLRLAGALRAIHERFVPDPWDHAHAMDVEFILHGPRRELVVVQARPYTLRYDQGRETAVEP
jgi:hypothetical protein